MVLHMGMAACPLVVGGETPGVLVTLKCLWTSFTSEKMQHETDADADSCSHVVIVPTRLGEEKAKLSVHQLIYIPTLTYGLELWLTRSWIQAAEMSYYGTVAGPTFGAPSPWCSLELLLHIERRALRRLLGIHPGRLPAEVPAKNKPVQKDTYG